MRQEFDLSEEDAEFLSAQRLLWESIIDVGTRWLLIHEFPVPDGYNLNVVTMALQIDPSYPTSQIDMVYFKPDLSLKSGRAIGALSQHSIAGETFQRWSRHRTAENPWRPGLDNVHTHIGLVEEWLYKEVRSG